MALKPDGKILSIREQIIEDPVSGLSIQFVVVPDSTAPFRMRLFGELPYGNREILFDAEGKEGGAGTALNGSCRPSWIREVQS